MVVHGGTYKGKPAKYVEEYIGSKPRDYYGGADKEITWKNTGPTLPIAVWKRGSPWGAYGDFESGSRNLKRLKNVKGL